MHIGICNKYCMGCMQSEGSEDSETHSSTKCHVCYKNWSDSSSPMEVDIILKGFEQAENMECATSEWLEMVIAQSYSCGECASMGGGAMLYRSWNMQTMLASGHNRLSDYFS